MTSDILMHLAALTKAVENLPGTVAAEVKRALDARRDDKLKPLSDIISVSTRAAQKRIARDPVLREMGVAMPNGQRYFEPDKVIAYFRTRAKNGGR